jgi:transcriptional regulator with XRE-family HTH domain
MQRLGDYVKAYRILRGLNQTEFGKLISRGQSRISELELGGRPGLGELLAISALIGVSLDDLAAGMSREAGQEEER